MSQIASSNILVFDQQILTQFEEQSSAALVDIASFCDRFTVRCFVLHHDAPALLQEGLGEIQTATSAAISLTTSLPNSLGPSLNLCANESCTCDRSVCMRDALLTVSDPDDLIFLVTKDEQSICLASYSDRIFAAGQSLKLCSELKLPHHPVVRWSDCSRLIQLQLSSRSGNIRRQARLHRMDAIKTE